MGTRSCRAESRKICRRKKCERRGLGVIGRRRRDVKQILRFLAILLSVPAGLIALAIVIMVAGWVISHAVFG